MIKNRTDIAYFLTVALTAGLFLSTFHIHAETSSSTYGQSETGMEYAQDHNFCPICGVVFEGSDIVCNELPGPDFTIEYLPLPTDKIVTQNLYAAKKGRSPPASLTTTG